MNPGPPVTVQTWWMWSSLIGKATVQNGRRNSERLHSNIGGHWAAASLTSLLLDLQFFKGSAQGVSLRLFFNSLFLFY